MMLKLPLARNSLLKVNYANSQPGARGLRSERAGRLAHKCQACEVLRQPHQVQSKQAVWAAGNIVSDHSCSRAVLHSARLAMRSPGNVAGRMLSGRKRRDARSHSRL